MLVEKPLTINEERKQRRFEEIERSLCAFLYQFDLKIIFDRSIACFLAPPRTIAYNLPIDN
ncbi:MAG: hypothetical protein ACRC2R_23490 [Xenococcaceae cyanobacterium]